MTKPVRDKIDRVLTYPIRRVLALQDIIPVPPTHLHTMSVGSSGSEVALVTAAIRTRMIHLDADLLQDSLYIVGYPYPVFNSYALDSAYVP